jgi:hypothetical protein
MISILTFSCILKLLPYDRYNMDRYLLDLCTAIPELDLVSISQFDLRGEQKKMRG